MHSRRILDGVLVANECIHSKFRERSPKHLCKLDLEKAYAKVDWGFLTCMTSGLAGFRSVFLQLGSLFSLMGLPKVFLFVIVGEAFSRMIGVAERANLICGFSPAPLAPTVSHLQFANDTIIFCEAHKD